METLKKFGERLRGLRKERHLLQRQMAELLGITDVHYRRMEAGKVNIPSLTLYALAEYFDVSADYLLGRTEERTMGIDIKNGIHYAERKPGQV